MMLECRASPPGAPGLIAVAGTSGFAFSGAHCGVRAGVVDALGTLAPVAGVGGAKYHQLAYAEPFLAFTAGDTVRVLDLATGARRDLPPGYAAPGSALALQPDGTLFTGPSLTGTGDGVREWPPGAARPALIGRPPFVERLFAAGGRAFFDGRSPLGLAGAGAVADVGAPGAGAPSEPLAFDGTHAAFRSISCFGRSQVTLVDVDAPQRGLAGCPVRLFDRTIGFGPPGRGTVSLRCRNGCQAELRLTRTSTPRHRCGVVSRR